MADSITSEAEGNRVVAPDGSEVGIVKSVDNGLAYVKPDPSTPETVMAKLGLGESSRHAYPLDGNKVEQVTAEAVHLAEMPDFGDA
jgi:hypothetical protein